MEINFQPRPHPSLHPKFLCRNLRKGETANFSPLAPKVLVPGKPLPFSLFLKISRNHHKGLNFLPFLLAGEIPEPRWLNALEKKGITHLYFNKADMDRVLAYLDGHLSVFAGPHPGQARDKITTLAEYLHLSLRQNCASPRLHLPLQNAQSKVHRLVHELEADAKSLPLVKQALYRDHSLYSHSVNNCLLGAALMLFMKESPQDSLVMGLAGLFHDLGKARIDEEILNKPGPLTPEEWRKVKKHPSISHRLVQRHDLLPPEGLRLVLEHHENADGSGYPLGLPQSRQHPWTQLLRLIDAYNALTASRPYRPAKPPLAALFTLYGQQGKVFSPPILKDFIRFLASA